MDRRRFVLGTVLALLARPVVAEAQGARNVYRVGWLGDTFAAGFAPGTPTILDVYRDTLRSLGYKEGQNLVLEIRSPDGQLERLPALAAELARLAVDAILAVTSPATEAAMKATKTIPVIFTIVSDPDVTGVVASLARPGGNVTGVTTLYPEAAAKVLELLREVMPAVVRVGILTGEYGPTGGVKRIFDRMEAAGGALGMTLELWQVQDPQRLEGVFGEMKRRRMEAVFVVPGRVVFRHKDRIARLALDHRLPAVSIAATVPQAGGLMSYAYNGLDMFRRAASLTDKILKEANPAELPVERPTRFDLVVNMGAARALGLTIPPSLLLRADRVIE